MATHEPRPHLIGALLRIAFQATVERVRERLADAGYRDLTMAHFSVFQHLPPGGARVTTLAMRAQMTKQSMSALVEHLERQGYLERRPDPADKRASVVDLTARGEALVLVARRAIQELELEWDARVGAARMEQLRGTLRDLAQLIEQVEGSESAQHAGVAPTDRRRAPHAEAGDGATGGQHHFQGAPTPTTAMVDA